MQLNASSGNKTNRLRTLVLVLAFALLAPQISFAASTAKTQPSVKTLTGAIDTAEKMYYCGELYLFADSMIKISYELASISANLKDSAQSGASPKSGTELNALINKYNAISETYNSWVDVKEDLSFFIDTIGSRGVFSKSQLQIAFRRTLLVISDTEAALADARDYSVNQTALLRRALSVSADKAIKSASGAVTIIKPYAKAALSGYRGFFDQFAEQSGIEIEYKTRGFPENLG